MTESEKSILKNGINTTMNLGRGLILDAVEAEFDDPQAWAYLRGRLLKLLSQDRGLHGSLLKLLDQSNGNAGGNG